VYIAPLKALVRERIEDWKVRIEQKLGKKYEVLLIYYYYGNRTQGTVVKTHTHTQKYNQIERKKEKRKKKRK